MSPRLPHPPRLRLLLLLFSLVSHAIATQQTAHEHLVRAPCRVSISQPRHSSSPHQHRPVDVYVSGIHLARFHVSDAAHSDAAFHHFPHLPIFTSGLVRVRLVQSTRDPAARISVTSLSGQTCPVILRPHPPPNTGFAGPSAADAHRDVPDASPEEEEDVDDETDQEHQHGRPGDRPVLRQAQQFRPQFENSIVGGQTVSGRLLPYLVNIVNPIGTSCTGTLLSPTWVLTAAHCNITASNTVYVLSSQVHRDGFPFAIKTILRAPGYEDVSRSADKHDVALLELRDSTASLSVKYMPINMNMENPTDRAFVRMLGYGRISSTSTTFQPDPAPLSLRQVDAPIANFSQCQRTYRRALSTVIPLYHGFHFCVGYEEGGCDQCLGDSGGPVIQYDEWRPVLVGVISGSVQCGETGIPGVIVRIAAQRAWLESSGAMYFQHTTRLDQVFDACTGPGRGLRHGRCVLCPPGRYSPDGVDHCLACRAGSYAAGQGNRRCLPCAGAERKASSCEQ